MIAVAIALVLAGLAVGAVLGGARVLAALRALPAILDDAHDLEASDEDPVDAHAASVLALFEPDARCTCDPGPDRYPHREWCALNGGGNEPPPPVPVLDYRAVGRVPRVRVEHIAHAACRDRRRWRGQHWHGTGAYLIVNALREERGNAVRSHRTAVAA